MRSIAYYWKEGLRNIFKHGFMSVAAVVIMVVSLLLTGTVTLVAYNITNNITRLQQSNQIVVWIDDSLTTREAKTLQTQFEKIDNIASITFEDRDVALEQYRKELGDDADILEDYNADNNPLRNSYVFTLNDSTQADATIKEIEAAQIPRSLKDVDIAVVNGNYALEAGLKVNKDALATEDADAIGAKTYGNIVAVKKGNEKTDATKALIKALKSDTVKKYINDKYDGAVVPLF